MPEWEPLDEEQRLAIVRDILEEHPQHDVATSLAGALLGPVTADRPDLPVWECLDFVAADPSVPLSALTAVRSPSSSSRASPASHRSMRTFGLRRLI